MHCFEWDFIFELASQSVNKTLTSGPISDSAKSTIGDTNGRQHSTYAQQRQRHTRQQAEFCHTDDTRQSADATSKRFLG